MGKWTEEQWIRMKLGDASQEQLESLEDLFDLRATTQGDRARITDAILGLHSSIPMKARILKDVEITVGESYPD